MCAGFAAYGRSRLSSRESHWFAPVPLAAVQPDPWLRPATTYFPYRIGGEDRRNQATEQPSRNNKTNELRDQPDPNKARKREEITVAVCVYCWGRQSAASLVTSVLNGLSNKTSGKANKREAQEQTPNRTKPLTHREARQTLPSKQKEQATPTTQTTTTKEEGTKNTNQDKGQRGRQARPNTAGRGGKQASGDPQTRKNGRPGKAAEAGRSRQHKPR